MKAFSVIFALLLMFGVVASLGSSEVTQSKTATITLDRVTAGGDSLDSVLVGPFTHDMGLMGVWIEGDTVPTTTAYVLDSLRFFWRPELGTYWRPLFIDTTGSTSTPVNGTGPVYVNSATGTVSAGTKATTPGLSLTTLVPKYAVFYDPSNPLPFPAIAEDEYIWLMVSRTNHAATWVNIFTFMLRVEKDAP